jgi:type I restriction-modification system DNA methylase subunit
MNLSSAFDENTFIRFIQDFLPDFVLDKRTVSAQKEIFPKVTYLGGSEKLRTAVLVVNTSLGINSRISLTKASFKILKNFSIYRAVIVYLNEDQTIWRLSLLTAQPMLVDGKVVQAFSNPERHSYVLGSDVGVATARKYLLGMGRVADFEDLKYRFSIEAINKDFYNDVTRYFYDLIGTYDSEGKRLKKATLSLPGKASHMENQEYAIRLFGRIIFCWFLREKKSSNNRQLLPSEVFDGGLEKHSAILNKVLEPLFFECLNKPLGERDAKYTKNGYELVPYLNGGLFYPNEGSGGDYYPVFKTSTRVTIPDEWFIDLFETLKTYNFTIDENLDFDVELSIDPEMLGRIFENLLAEINPETGESARRATGSFYTPRKIVSYMTDMCLTKYLLDETNISEEQINALMTINNVDDLKYQLSDSEKKQVADKLYSLKSLDPACGSGAFPIGLLQKMVFLLEQVDSDFEISKKKFGKTFFVGKHHLSKNKNYLRKLVLIRDVIHGVDIQPVAVEISKLRCFLTLIVEQDVLDDLDNRGLEPLPNLDFQFVCANSLIGLNEQKQMMLGDDFHLEEELSMIREEYYSTNSSKRRESLKQKYLKIVKEEMSLFGESSRATQLKSFQPFIVNNQADFFDPKTMFGIENFDIVIGNPPYVKVEHLDKSVVAILKSHYSEIHNGKAKPWADDLYVHFIFKAFELIKSGGSVCFITNDSFIGLASKARVRTKLLDENLLEIIRCPKETFGATIYTAIFLASGSKSKVEQYLGASFGYPGFEILDINAVRKSYVQSMPNERFVLQEDGLVFKLLAKDRVVKYLRVIDTGIHTGNVRKKLFYREATPKIKDKLIQGRQIQRWVVWWDGPSAKYKYCDPNYQPKDSFGIGRGGKSSSLKEYWGFSGNVENHFVSERVLIRQTADNIFGAYQSIKEDGQFYTDNTLFTVLLKDQGGCLKYFLAILNSKMLNYIYKYLSMEEGKVLAQVKTELVEQLPIVYDRKREKEVVALVDKLISTKRSNHEADVSEVEKELDLLVCQIYGLSESETNQVLALTGF